MIVQLYPLNKCH